MKGRWAAGIVPRNFSWIIKGHLAVAERPGGSAPAHRRVRRHEEILWLRAQGFTKVVSLLPSSHNLHAYEELGIPYEHVPMGLHDDPTNALSELYPALLGWLFAGERILIHQDELGERLAGVLAGFLWWSGMIPEPPLAISAIEQLLRRQLGATGRTIVTLAVDVPPPSEEDRRRAERPALVALRIADLPSQAPAPAPAPAPAAPAPPVEAGPMPARKAPVKPVVKKSVTVAAAAGAKPPARVAGAKAPATKATAKPVGASAATRAGARSAAKDAASSKATKGATRTAVAKAAVHKEAPAAAKRVVAKKTPPRPGRSRSA